jgi:hypothetical protein
MQETLHIRLFIEISSVRLAIQGERTPRREHQTGGVIDVLRQGAPFYLSENTNESPGSLSSSVDSFAIVSAQLIAQ